MADTPFKSNMDSDQIEIFFYDLDMNHGHHCSVCASKLNSTRVLFISVLQMTNCRSLNQYWNEVLDRRIAEPVAHLLNRPSDFFPPKLSI